MKKIFFITVLTTIMLYAQTINTPNARYISSGAVSDIVYKNFKLYSATDASCVDIFDKNSKKIVQKIMVDKIVDFMGDSIDSKVYSVDVWHSKVLVLSLGKRGARRVHIYENGKLNLVLPASKGLYIAKAKFIDEHTILLALLSNMIISYDIQTQKENYEIQASQSKFSDFVLNEDKTQVVIADESGNLQIHNTKDGSFVKELAGENLDNVFQVDIKNNVIATAGKDRRVVIYNGKRAYYKKAKFLIYSVGLSPSGKIVGYASDENNNVTLFKTATKTKIGVYGGNKMTLTNIIFINENEFFVSSDDKTINYYKIR